MAGTQEVAQKKMSGHQEAVVKELTQFEGGLNYGNHRKCYERLGRKWRDRKNLWKMCQAKVRRSLRLN